MHDLDLALFDERSENLVLSSLVEQRVVIRFRAINSDDLFLPLFREMIDQELGLQLTHFLVVERHVKIQVAIGD